jgi:crotonobetainyl-CoA:carnitine CoA-transferase CaiB-like acyl-CoA transferase
MRCASRREAAIRPLADITVVEAFAPGANLALRLAGAMAGRIAADCGARVLVHEPDDDPLRKVAPFVGGTSAIHAFLNRGKAIVPARNAAPGIAAADVVILDAAAAREPHERPPIVAALSMFRADGAQPASEFTVMALGGLLDMVGDPSRAPLRLAGHQAAYAAGLAAYTGIAAALCRPRVGGRIPADTVRVSMLDVVIWLNWKSVPSRPGQPKLTRSGDTAEWQVVRCADGFVALVYQEPDWAALCDIVDDARLREPSLLQRPERIRRSREIAAIVEERFLTLTRREIHARALARRIPLGPIWSPGELASDPQTMARDFLRVEQVEGRAVTMPRLPVLWSNASLDAAPALAQAAS